MEEIEGAHELRGGRNEVGLERRRHKRYTVDGVAEVLVSDGSLLFRGRVLDISVDGCLIETQARLCLKLGTRVDMLFHVNGKVFRPAATARMVRPLVGAGFLFENLDARMQEKLEELIGELSVESAPKHSAG